MSIGVPWSWEDFLSKTVFVPVSFRDLIAVSFADVQDPQNARLYEPLEKEPDSGEHLPGFLTVSSDLPTLGVLFTFKSPVVLDEQMTDAFAVMIRLPNATMFKVNWGILSSVFVTHRNIIDKQTFSNPITIFLPRLKLAVEEDGGAAAAESQPMALRYHLIPASAGIMRAANTRPMVLVSRIVSHDVHEYPLWAAVPVLSPSAIRTMYLSNYVDVYLALDAETLKQAGKYMPPKVYNTLDSYFKKPAAAPEEQYVAVQEVLEALGKHLVEKSLVRARYTMPPPLYHHHMYPRGLGCREFYVYIDAVYRIVVEKRSAAVPATVAVPKMFDTGEEELERAGVLTRGKYGWEFSECGRAMAAFLLPQVALEPIKIFKIISHAKSNPTKS